MCQYVYVLCIFVCPSRHAMGTCVCDDRTDVCGVANSAAKVSCANRSAEEKSVRVCVAAGCGEFVQILFLYITMQRRHPRFPAEGFVPAAGLGPAQRCGPARAGRALYRTSSFCVPGLPAAPAQVVP